MPKGGRTEKSGETGSQESDEAGASEAASLAMVELLREQLKTQQTQQGMLMALLEQQKEEMVHYRKELTSRREEDKPTAEGAVAAKLPKPTLQKLSPDDDIEHFLATFERIAMQQEWPTKVWATQLAGLLTGKAMAAYTSLGSDDAAKYVEVKKAVLHRYDVNDESHRRRFRQDRKRPEESYRNWGDRLRDHFRRWTKDQEMTLEELMIMDQFIHGVPEELGIWLRERKPKSMQEAMEMADDYTLARRGNKTMSRKPFSGAGGGLPNESRMEGRATHPRPPVTQHRVSLPEEGRSRTNMRGDKRCFQCGRWGHLMYNCPNRRENESSGATRALYAKTCDEVAWNVESHKYLRRGTLEGRPVQMLVDTGCEMSMVSTRLVDPAKVDSQRYVPVMCTHGDTMLYPTATVKLQTGQWECESCVVVAPNLPVDVLLGRDIYDPGQPKQSFAVVTRAQSRRMEHGPSPSGTSPAVAEEYLSNQMNSNEDSDELRGKEESTPVQGVRETDEEDPHAGDGIGKGPTCQEVGSVGDEASMDTNGVLAANPAKLKDWQQRDPTLVKVRELAAGGQVGDNARASFYYKEGLLHRQWHPQGTSPGDVRSCEQLVLPRACRSLVLRLAHDIPMAGHLGVTKTKDRILQRYYWPGIFKEVAEYCRSCEVCQRSQPRPAARAEMVPMPLVSTPFKRIAMDLVGPLPRTKRGNRFILTICDYATRYPEAIALSSTEASQIARELIGMFARVGVPEEILTDQGPNFMSSLLQELYRLLQIKRIRTTPYHPQTDGLVERFNGTLKAMLKKFVNRTQKDWDEYLPYLLFAYREVPQESTGFSPFELLYGRRVRGPLDVLRETWTGESEEGVPGAACVVEMRNRLHEMTELVRENAGRAQQRQKRVYDRRAKQRSLDAGDQVLVLLPKPRNHLKLEWFGPYTVSRKLTTVDYEVKTPGRRSEKKVYHINLLKKWYPNQLDTATVCLAVLDGNCETEGDMEIPVTGMQEEDELYPSGEGSAVNLQDVASSLTEQQQQQLHGLMEEFPAIFSETPGRTKLTEHHIHVGDAAPIRQKPYRIPYSQREVVKQELEDMMEAGVIRPSTSPWASPIVLVEKKDGGVRFCVDYRKLNQVAKFDAYPMPRIEEMFEKIGPATVISTLDLAKGYWQIPMAPESREKTAFATPFGLFEFEVMPFGLHSAPATFQRTVNHVLRECQGYAGAYIDDIARGLQPASAGWPDSKTEEMPVWAREGPLLGACCRERRGSARTRKGQGSPGIPNTSNQERCPGVSGTSGVLSTFRPPVCLHCSSLDRSHQKMQIADSAVGCCPGNSLQAIEGDVDQDASAEGCGSN